MKQPETLNLFVNEKRYIIRAMKRSKGNRTKAAKLLGINPRTLSRKINDYDLKVE
jgi:two-component system response regulator FlrC